MPGERKDGGYHVLVPPLLRALTILNRNTMTPSSLGQNNIALPCGPNFVGLLYTSRNFSREVARGDKRWWLSYITALIIASAYHLEYKYNDAPKFVSTLPCYAVWHKFCGTFYGPPINVETFRFS
jgi:hypothetical protein